MRKRSLWILIGIISILVITITIIMLPIIKNNSYDKQLIKNIYNNTDIKDISYINKDNNYYIVKSNDKIIVLDLNYETVYEVDISSVKESSLEFSYKQNKLYYREKIREDNKIIYKYYDINNLEYVFEVVVGGA